MTKNISKNVVMRWTFVLAMNIEIKRDAIIKAMLYVHMQEDATNETK